MEFGKTKEQLLKEIAEERTRLIAELFAKPDKKRLLEIEQRIVELDTAYMELLEEE